MQDFRNLKVWAKSHLLTLEIYKATVSFPKEEVTALAQQIRRSATAIPTTIAEGAGRDTSAEFARFLRSAGTSAGELEYQLLLARDLGYLVPDSYARLTTALDEIERMLAGLIQTVSSA